MAEKSAPVLLTGASGALGRVLAKGLAAARGLPLLGVNHLAGHALTPRLTEPLAFPYLMLLVSGGHCQFLAVEGPETFRRRRRPLASSPTSSSARQRSDCGSLRSTPRPSRVVACAPPRAQIQP